MTILLLSRHQELTAYRAEALRGAGFDVLAAASKQEALETIGSQRFDLALLSYSLSDDTAQELAELVRQSHPQCVIIAIAEHGWDDSRIKPDDLVVGSEGPQALIEAILRATRGKLRRVK